MGIKRYEIFREEVADYDARKFGEPEDVYDFAINTLKVNKRTQERLWLFCLDAKNNVNACVEVSIGGSTTCMVDPKEIFRTALVNMADAIILMHNHPSGDPTPSKRDVSTTKSVIAAGELLGIRLHDHIIVGDGGFTSLCRLGYIKKGEKHEGEDC